MSEDQKRDAEKSADLEAKAKALRVEQDSRVARQKAEAEAKGGGPDKPEEGLNQDG